MRTCPSLTCALHLDPRIDNSSVINRHIRKVCLLYGAHVTGIIAEQASAGNELKEKMG